MFKGIRKIQTWKTRYKAAIVVFVAVLFFGAISLVHTSFHGDAETRRYLQKHALPECNIESPNSIEAYYTSARHLTWGLHEVDTKVTDGCPPYGPEAQHLFMRTSPAKGLDHICIQAGLGRGITIFFPEGADEKDGVGSWLHSREDFYVSFPALPKLVRLKREINSVTQSPLGQSLEDRMLHQKKVREIYTLLAKVAYVMQLSQNSRLPDQYKRGVKERKFAMKMHDLVSSVWLMTILGFVLFLVICSLLTLKWFYMPLSRIVKNSGTEEAEVLFEKVTEEFLPQYIKHGWTSRLKSNIQAYCRKYARQELSRRGKIRRQRSLLLRERLLNEQQAAQLEARVQEQATKLKIQSKGSKQGSSTAVLEQARRAIRADVERTVTADVTQSGIIHITQLLEQDLSDRFYEDDEPEALPADYEEREVWLKAIQACTHDGLRHIESMPSADLKRLAKVIRNLKRNLRGHRDSWTQFTRDFDGRDSSSYLDIIALAEQGNFAAIQQDVFSSDIAPLRDSSELLNRNFPPLPQSLGEIPAFVEEHCGGRIHLHGRALQALKKSTYESPELVGQCLHILSQEYWEMRQAEKKAYKKARSAFDQALESIGVLVSKSAKPSTLKRLSEIYSVQWPEDQSSRQTLRWHLKQGTVFDDTRTLRIYYFYCPDNQVIVVGHLPGHLRNALT